MSAPTKGMVAGQPIKTGAPTKEYDENYDRIFGKREKPERGSFVWDRRQGKLVPAAEYVPVEVEERKNVPIVSDRYMEGVATIEGEDISSRRKRREYMARNELADASDYQRHHAERPKRMEREEAREVERITEQVGRTAYELTQKGRRR